MLGCLERSSSVATSTRGAMAPTRNPQPCSPPRASYCTLLTAAQRLRAARMAGSSTVPRGLSAVTVYWSFRPTTSSGGSRNPIVHRVYRPGNS